LAIAFGGNLNVQLLRLVLLLVITALQCLSLFGQTPRAEKLQVGHDTWTFKEGAPENVKHGDTIDIEITGIGTLSNPVVRAGR